ncbi:hypothetical protein HJFPF1_00532 [Paramyrothecium foliicola]|nr:hypothetical protein HJFPF1_00532 [Paramyrothecium foliicola]
MLGRLLHLGSGGIATQQPQAQSSSKPVSSLESVQEDMHTRNLLFPDTQALYQHRNDQVFPLSTTPTAPFASGAQAFDTTEDADLDVRDVRIVIMQDTLGPTNTSLLYDSHPLPAASSPESTPVDQSLRKTPLSPRKSSLGQSSRPLVIQPENTQPRQGAFDRRASLHGRSQSQMETETQRNAREYREELATFSSCIFGNSELMAYKGTSTKVHVVPVETRLAESNIFGDGRGSIGRSSGRSSKLSQSYSSQAVSPIVNLHSGGGATALQRQGDRKKVLITRLFPVNLSNEDLEPATTPHSRYSDDNNGFPFPPTGDEASQKKKKAQPRQRRTPMYAVVLVVQLPSTSSRISSAGPAKATGRESSSYGDQDFFPSSYNSTRFSGWNMAGSGTFGDATDSSFSLDVEDRIDSLTQHWDIIMRTLTHLQSVVATTLHTMLKQADMASPGPYAPSSVSNFVARSPPLADRRSGEMPRVKPPKSTTKLVALLPNCLADDLNVASEVEFARNRIVTGLGAARVVTGQGRWGIWRDEAIWASKWAIASDQAMFFHNLLTGFLATHTDWLQALCPPSYRKRLFLSRRNQVEEDLALPARTVIVSDDKMVARRLVFLLSAFLPANQQIPATRTHRASASASLGVFSHSPPTYVIPLLREESLRRKINRRSGLRRASHSRAISQSTRTSAVPVQLAHLSNEPSRDRRVSDAASVRTANLPLPANDLVSRKSSAATTTTIVPETTTPHFSTLQRLESHRRPRPGSSGSVAADDLKRSLKRGESSGHVSTSSTSSRTQGLKWGTLVSGLWNTRRRASMDQSEHSYTSDLRSPVKPTFSGASKLAEMVREVSLPEEEDGLGPHDLPRAIDARGLSTPRENSGPGRDFFAQADRTPDPTGAFESPVKTSINADDGVIDVDVAFPDYITSFESAISSPSSSGYLSTPGFVGGVESFEQSARLSVDGDLPLNAAGWLTAYHPDFAIQAIPPQEGLFDQIKASLRAEPTPAPAQPLGNDVSERWVDVGSVLVADTTNNAVTRILYRRLVKPKAIDRAGGGATGMPNLYGSALLTPSILPYETQLEEEWIEEPIFSSDESLREALEKVIHVGGDSSRDTSFLSSQASGVSRPSTDSGTRISDTATDTAQVAPNAFNTPRVQCKTVVLSALEDIIRDTIESREESKQGAKGHEFIRQNPLREAVREWLASLDATE